MAKRDGAAAIVIGDEILTGKIKDQNGPHLVGALRSLGLPLRRILTVEDEVDEIAWAVSSCAGRYGPIFTSGGIGPTHDDVTVAGVAKGLGRGVVQHPDLEALVRRHYGADMPPEALRVAAIPEGAELVSSPGAWFPVIAVEEIYLLPGIPELFERQLEAVATRYRGAPFYLRCVYLSVGEPAIAKILDKVAKEHPQVGLGSYPRLAGDGYRVKLTLEAQVQAPVDEALASLLELLPDEVVLRVE